MSHVDRIETFNANVTQRKGKSAKQEHDNSTTNTDDDTKSKRPKNTALKQQSLPAWQPVLTASTVLPLFFITGVIFIVLGGVLLHYSNIVQELVIDYTQCKSNTGQNTCADQIDIRQNNSFSNPNCVCTVFFKLDSTFQKPVYLYYGLNNFYQNHRRYVNSRDDNQLLGNVLTPSGLNTNCNPYGSVNGTVYAPCGAIANSLFNDTFTLQYQNVDNSTVVTVPLQSNNNIAWSSDVDVKFGNFDGWNNTVPPKNWLFLQGQSVGSIGGYKNQDFIVWMRTAALPNFRKLWRRVDHTASNFTNGLPNGWYSLQVTYRYPVTAFDGKKSFIISTSTWLGGKNPFLGIAYLVIGSLCILLGVVFLIVHLMFGKKINEEYNALKTMSEIAQ